MRSQKGQSIIEFLLVLIVAPGVLTLTAFALYTGLCRVTLDQQLYEGMICQIERAPASQCKRQAQSKIKSILLFGELEEFQITEWDSNFRGRLRFRVRDSEIKIEKTLQLPLR